MEWSRWLIGTTEREETCRFCCDVIKSGAIIVIEEATMEPECVLCHWERVRALVRKAKPKANKKGGNGMPWKQVGGSSEGSIMKWAQGMIIEGRLLERRMNKFGELMDFQDEKLGLITVGIPVRLKFRLDDADPAVRLKIECKGKVPIGSGKSAWDFEVYEDK